MTLLKDIQDISIDLRRSGQAQYAEQLDEIVWSSSVGLEIVMRCREFFSKIPNTLPEHIVEKVKNFQVNSAYELGYDESQ